MANKSTKRTKNTRKSKKRRRSQRRRPARINKKTRYMKMLAKERIDFLMNEAVRIHTENQKLADRYVALCRQYSMATKVDIPEEFKRLICHKCKQLMIPGRTSRSRIQSRKGKGSVLITTCLNCNNKVHKFIKAKK